MSPASPDTTLELLEDVASSFAAPDLERVRATRDAGGAVDREMWGRIAEAEWLGIAVPEALGGAGLGLDAVAIVARKLGYGCFPEPFVAAGVLAPLLLAACEEHDGLATVLRGETLVGVGWQFDVVADREGQAHSLSGTSRFIPVPAADAFVVAARAPEAVGTGLYWVPSAAPGLWIGTERCADGTLSARLKFTDVEARELVAPPRGGQLLDAALDGSRVAVSAELVGIGERVIELTLEHLKTRKQFGRPIGSFQALQHRAVDAWIQLQLATAALEQAVDVFLDPEATVRDRAAAASSAKARASEAVPGICSAALQLHGAIGFTEEYDLGLYLNRALTLAPWLGNAAQHRRRHNELLEAGGER